MKWKQIVAMRILSNNRFSRTILYGTLFTLSLIWIYFSRLPTDSTTTPGKAAPHPGFFAPEISLLSLTGEEISLSDFRGYPVILNFWTTWCPPCRAEMPAMQRAFLDYQDAGVIILAVNSTSQDSVPAVEDFISQFGITFPILLDKEGDVASLYQIASLPTTYFIDKSGIIREVVIGGPMSEALLRTRIEKLLKGSR
jgi:cytochrome c biogenesis protein CcmG, thiol:disulfide interchange protein DsbE